MNHLSILQLQRISIERTLATNQEFVVCDEAVSALDVSIQVQIITILKDMQEEMGVFCKTFLHKIAKTFCRSLQLHFVGNCKPGWQSWYLPAI